MGDPACFRDRGGRNRARATAGAAEWHCAANLPAAKFDAICGKICARGWAGDAEGAQENEGRRNDGFLGSQV